MGNQKKLKIKVAPSHLLEGEDSKTQITIGTRKFLNQTEEVSISLWVSNGSVFASHPSAETVQKRIESEASIMELEAELDQIIRIIRYSNSRERIVLFIFGIRSICDFRIIFKYLNSCHQISNSSRSKICIENTVKSPHLGMKIYDQVFLISFGHKFQYKIFLGLLFNFQYSVFK